MLALITMSVLVESIRITAHVGFEQCIEFRVDICRFLEEKGREHCRGKNGGIANEI